VLLVICTGAGGGSDWAKLIGANQRFWTTRVLLMRRAVSFFMGKELVF